ncbi:MAG TPA: homocysteine S-methyltransferase family protein, partial [Gemmatales bacterium]|nr:homocysteine S-methyltransferase family protein [Gemmatales bacterium]
MARPAWKEMVRDAHRQGKLILFDGPMGTELVQSGLNLETTLSHHWNITHPDAVRVVYEDYSNAGAQALLTNTFSAHVGIVQGEANWQQAVLAALELAREPEWDHLYAIGSLGTAVGEESTYQDAILRVAKLLNTADGLLLETQTRMDRTRVLTEQLVQMDLPPLMVSISYSRFPKEDSCWVAEDTTDEVLSAGEVAKWATTQPLLALGANCGNNLRLSDYLNIMREYREQTDIALFIRPGITPSIECEFSPKEFAGVVKSYAQAGVTMIGGCCGTT